MQVTTQIDILKWLIPLAGIAIATWVVTYTILAKWWTNPIGRSLVLFAGLNLADVIPAWMNLEYPQWIPQIMWFDVAIVGVTIPVMLWRAWIWIRASRSHEEVS